MMLRRALAPAIACLGASLLAFSVAPAVAQDGDQPDETADMTFEQSLVHQLLTGLGAVGATSNKGITYRERSPLVLPPSNALPTPQTGTTARAPNWPRDPDEMERAARAAAAKGPRQSPEEQMRPLSPTELARGRTAKRREAQAAAEQPGQNPVRQLSPTELGYKGGLFGNILTPQKQETATFTSEPPRDQLTAPPAGYQTPSPNYAYGVGVTVKRDVDPTRPLEPGKY